MGATQSKPRLRRSRRFSSLRKRQGPEGAHDPEPPVREARDPWRPMCNDMKAAYTNENAYEPDQKCKCCDLTETCIEHIFKRSALKAGNEALSCGLRCGISARKFEGMKNHEDFPAPTKDTLLHHDLKVDLPPPSNNRCRRWDSCPKSMIPTPTEPTKLSEKDEHEWTITLYEIDKLSGKVPREDMIRLMSSIYEAVDNKVGESPQGRKTVRVRLSVTPEPRNSTNKVQRTPSGVSTGAKREGTPCQCPDCPKTEPPARRAPLSRVRRQRSDASPTRVRQELHSNEAGKVRSALDARQQCAARDISRVAPVGQHRPVGFQKDRPRRLSKDDNFDNEYRRRIAKRTPNKENSLSKHYDGQNKIHLGKNSKNEDRAATKAPGAKRRPRQPSNDPRNVMLRTRRKDPRFASPYDQHFHEAMYLRLRELQRKGAFEARRATGLLGDSDDADQDSNDSDCEEQRKELEERNCSQNLEEENAESSDKKQAENNSETPTSVHYHHHYHHGIPPNTIIRALTGAENATDHSEHSLPPYPVSSENYHGAPNPSESTNASNSKPHHHYHHHYHHAEET